MKQTARYLAEQKKIRLIPYLIVNSGFRYLGYLAGKRYRILPRRLILYCTMNKNYWKGYKGTNV